MTEKLWVICGYDSMEQIFEIRVPVGCFSEKQIQELLKALAAKAGLSFDEIVGAYAKRNTALANVLLGVNKDERHQQYTCGSNPHFIARIVSTERYN